MAGSFSQTSMIASETSPVSKAFSSAPVSIISPREVLMITGFRFSDWKKGVVGEMAGLVSAFLI